MLSVVPRNAVHDVVNNAYYAVMGHNENVSVVITVFFDKIFEPCFNSVKKSMGTFTVGLRLVETEGAEKNARIFAQCIGVQHSAEFAVVDFAQARFGVHGQPECIPCNAGGLHGARKIAGDYFGNVAGF